MTQTLSIKETRDKLADVVNQVSIAGDTFIITKFGKPKAMIIPIAKVKAQRSILEETFGAWKERGDIKDSAKWVASLRAKMSTRE